MNSIFCMMLIFFILHFLLSIKYVYLQSQTIKKSMKQPAFILFR
jgi:hypothetical protein